MKLVFVDIDGVMIPLKEESFSSLVFNPIAVAMLNCLTGETGAHIVASSRKCEDLDLEQVRRVFTANCVHGEVIGRIPSSAIVGTGRILQADSKGVAIQKWLDMFRSIEVVERYVILDDETISEHPDNSVVVDPTLGFVTFQCHDQARAILTGR